MSEPTRGFNAIDRWNFTLTSGPTGSAGDPATLTWSIAPDSTSIPSEPNSDFISFLDGIIGAGPGGSDLSQRPWFPLIEDSFNRWEELSGLTFVYDPNNAGELTADDGAQLNNTIGILGTRGEIRVAGTFLDGNGGTSAMAGFVPDSDITMDTGDVTFYSNSGNNYRNFRGTLMHEIGHSIGLAHIFSFQALLMEPAFNPGIDGPQIDEIRAVHSLYGDYFEGAPVGKNDSWQSATDLGALLSGESVALGTDVGPTVVVNPNDTDFVSISNLSDIDFFSFSVSGASTLDVVVTPVGPDYQERNPGGGAFVTTESDNLNDLQFEIYGPGPDVGDPNLLATIAATGTGLAESVTDFSLPEAGEYFIAISGSNDLTQLYQLDISVESTGIPGDFDGDDKVDGFDFLLWQRDQSVGDLSDWQTNYGTFASTETTAESIPEPGTGTLLFFATLALMRCTLSKKR